MLFFYVLSKAAKITCMVNFTLALFNGLININISLEMEKETVLVCDKKGFFLKMFRRNFKNEFDFSQKAALCSKEYENFDRHIFVVYDKFDFFEYLKFGRRGFNFLICFNSTHLFSTLSFLVDIENYILLDGFETRTDVIMDLKNQLTAIPALGTIINKREFMHPE